MAELAALWPIINQASSSLFAEATADLIEHADATGRVITGAPVFDRTREHIAALVPVLPITSYDPRPWESREAMADELFDWRAA